MNVLPSIKCRHASCSPVAPDKLIHNEWRNLIISISIVYSWANNTHSKPWDMPFPVKTEYEAIKLPLKCSWNARNTFGFGSKIGSAVNLGWIFVVQASGSLKFYLIDWIWSNFRFILTYSIIYGSFGWFKLTLSQFVSYLRIIIFENQHYVRFNHKIKHSNPSADFLNILIKADYLTTKVVYPWRFYIWSVGVWV